MKEFFTIYQTKRFSHNEKIQWIFKQLITTLNPIIVGEETDIYTTMNSHGKLVNKRDKIKLVDISTDKIKVAQTIEIPFKDVQLSVNEKEVSISGKDFCYKFPPDYILLVWNRIRKVLK